MSVLCLDPEPDNDAFSLVLVVAVAFVCRMVLHYAAPLVIFMRMAIFLLSGKSALLSRS